MPPMRARRPRSRERSRGIISPPGGNRYEFFGLNDICGELVPVNTACIQSDGLFPASRLGGRPMAKQHNLVAVVSIVPGSAFATGTVLTQRSQLRHIFGGLGGKRNS